MSKYPFILIMCMFIAQSVFAQSYSKYFRLANQDTVNFTFTVKKPDIKAIDCYPQRITQISKNGDNYEISLTTINPWPECYIERAGWCSVDPTMPSYICPHFAEIRMRYGIDYEDCDIKTLNYDIEPIEFTKR